MLQSAKPASSLVFKSELNQPLGKGNTVMRLVRFEDQAEMTSRGLAILQDGDAFLSGTAREEL